MTTRTIKGILQAALLGGGVCLLSAGASADEPRADVPDHAQAEARTGAETSAPEAERIEGVPDHGQAEARAPKGGAAPTELRGTPDHAAAESHGADSGR